MQRKWRSLFIVFGTLTAWSNKRIPVAFANDDGESTRRSDTRPTRRSILRGGVVAVAALAGFGPNATFAADTDPLKQTFGAGKLLELPINDGSLGPNVNIPLTPSIWTPQGDISETRRLLHGISPLGRGPRVARKDRQEVMRIITQLTNHNRHAPEAEFRKVANWAADELRSIPGIEPAGRGAPRAIGKNAKEREEINPFLDGFQWWSVFNRGSSFNVIGYLPPAEGTDVNEALMAMGHLDAVRGVDGADDNGSGSTGVLRLARMLAAESKRTGGFRRGIFFFLTSAEEYGLIGSTALAKTATHLAEGKFDGLKVVSVFNTDMISRMKGEQFILFGGADEAEARKNPIYRHAMKLRENTRGEQLPGIIEGHTYMPEQRIWTRSDHYNFIGGGGRDANGLYNIQGSFGTTGLHDAYHSKQDTIANPGFSPVAIHAVSRHTFHSLKHWANAEKAAAPGRILPLEFATRVRVNHWDGRSALKGPPSGFRRRRKR